MTIIKILDLFDRLGALRGFSAAFIGKLTLLAKEAFKSKSNLNVPSKPMMSNSCL